MANTGGNLENRGDQLNEAQLRALEGISPDTPENQVLDKAHEIGLINDDTVKSIRAAIPNHVLLFQRALAMGRREAGTRTDTDTSIAFKRAFESVYGRFLLDQGPKMVKDAEGNSVIAEGEMEHPDHHFMKTLDKVLKVKVSPEFGLKGRSELQAVVRRLREVTAARGVGERNKGKIAELTTKKTEASAKIPDLQQKLQTLNATEVSLNAIAAPTTKLDGFLSRIGRFGGMTADSRELIDSLAKTKAELESDFGVITDNRDAFFRRVGEMRGNLEQVVSSLSAGYADVFKEEELRELMTDIDGIMQNPDANNVDWQNFIEGKLKKLVKKISTGIFYQNVSDPLYTSPEIKRRIDELVGHFNYLRGHVDDLVIYNKRVEELKHVAESAEGHTENRDAVFSRKVERSRDQALDELEKIIPVVQSLIDNDQLASLAPECKKECEAFIKQCEDFDDTTDITDFVNNIYKPFAAKLRTVINEAKGEFGAELSVTITQVEGLDSEIKGLQSYKSPALMLESILERAFGKQKTPDEMKAIEDKHGIAERKKAALEEEKKYFGGDEVKAVDKKYKEILGASTSPSDIQITAASLRQKKAALDLKNDEKGKLEELKVLFAEKKIGEVQDKFLELEGLLPGYLTSGAGDFEGKLARKKSEADLLKGTIDNYEKTGRPLLASSIQQEKANLSRLKGDPNVDPLQIRIMDKAVFTLEAALAINDEEFETNRAKFRDLGVSISQLEKFRDGLKAFRSDVLDLARGCEKAVELGVLNLNGATKDAKLDELSKLKGFFNSLSVNSSSSDLGALKRNYDSLSKNFVGVSKAAEATLKGADYGVTEQQSFNDESGKIEKAKKLYEDLEPIVSKFVKAAQNGVNLNSSPATPENKGNGVMETQDEADQRASVELAHAIEIAFKAIIKPDHKDFKVSEIALFYDTHLKKFLGSDENRKALLTKINVALTKAEKEVKAANKELTLAKEAAEKCKDLTDPQAALKIVGVLVAEQFPKLSMTEQEKLAKLILAGDVAKLQTEEGYDALAKRGSAEDLNLENLHALAVRGKLIGFKYQEGDKEVQPFKGMKPENFKDWASIEKLFNLGQLNHKNGFFLMAALEIFDEEKGKIPGQGEEAGLGVIRSIQSLRVEDKLKFLLAKQLGVHERMHVAGVNKIINDAFKEQMEKVRPLVKAHFSTYENEWDKGGKGVKAHKIQLLKLKYQELNDKLRKGEIDHAVYEIKLKTLTKEAEEADVVNEVGFSEKSILSGFWHSKYSQWVRDRGHDAGKYVGKKALRFGWGALKGSGLGMLNATGWVGLRAGSLATGLAKWPAAVLTGIGSGIFSIFRRGKWMDNVKKDVGNVMSTAGGWQDAMKGKAKGVKILSPIGKQIAGEWGKSKYEGTKYADRVKKKEDRRAEKLKVLEEKAKLKAVEIASSPFIDLAQYKAKIEELDKILGTTTKFPAEGNVKVGHEEKAAVNADKKDDHGHQPPAAAAHH